MRRRLNTKSLIAVCYLLLLTAGVYNTALLPGRTILPADLLLLTPPWKHHSQELMPGFQAVSRPAWDPLFQFYPARKYLAESLRAGRTPLWNPHSFSGTPFAADGQSAVYYPPNWLFAVLPLASAFGWLAALHTFLAGLFFALYGRRMGWGWAATLTGATAWMLCGVMVVWQMWQVIDAAMCWLPLALYFWEGWRRSGRPNQLAGVAVALGLSALAGHLQFTYYVFLTVLGYGVLRSFTGPSTPSVSRSKSLAALALAFAIGIGIAAVQLFATGDYLMHTNRTQLSLPALIGTAMPPAQLLMLVAPDIFGGQRDVMVHPFMGVPGNPQYYELGCFCGAAALVLAAFGIRWKRSTDEPVEGPAGAASAPTESERSFAQHPPPGRWSPDDARPRTLFWLGLAVFALLMGCGSPLYALFYYGVPLFKSFHGPARIFILLDFAVAVLAAEGVQRLVTMEMAERRRYAGRIFGALFVCILLGLRFAVTNTNPDVAYRLTHEGGPQGWMTYSMIQLGVALAAVAAACAVLALAPKRFAAIAALVVVSAECLTFAVGVNSSVPSTLLYPSTPDTQFISQHLGDARVWCLSDGNPAHGQSRLVPNSAMALGWNDVAGSDPLEMKSYQPISDQLDRAQQTAPPGDQPGSVAPVRDLLNRLNVRYVLSPRPLADRDLVQAFQGDMYVYENPSAFGVARLQSSSTTSTAMPVEAAYPGVINLVNQSEEPGLLTTSVVYDSAWKAFVDGKPAPTASDSIYLSAPVPSGRHRVEFDYRPESVEVGLYLTCLSWFGVSLLCLRRKAQ